MKIIGFETSRQVEKIYRNDWSFKLLVEVTEEQFERLHDRPLTEVVILTEEEYNKLKGERFAGPSS